MKAAVYHEDGGSEVGPGQVLLRTAAVGVQGGDLLHRQGAPLPAAPHVVGYQGAGTVAAVGAGVAAVREGQRVVSFVEFALAEAAEAHRCIESRVAFGRVLLIP